MTHCSFQCHCQKWICNGGVRKMAGWVGKDGGTDLCMHGRERLNCVGVWGPSYHWEAMLMCKAWGHVDICDLCCHSRPCLSPWSCGSWGPCGHVDVHSQCYHQRPPGCLWSVLHLKPCWCPLPVLLPKTMLRPRACADTRGQVGACGPCCQQIPLGSLWSVLLLTIKDREAPSAVITMTADWQLEQTEKASVTTPTSTSTPKQGMAYTKSHQRECLKNVIRMEKLSTTDSYWQGWGKAHFPLKVFDHTPETIWKTQIGLDFFFNLFLGGEATKVGEWTWGDWEVRLIMVHYVKFPNNQ